MRKKTSRRPAPSRIPDDQIAAVNMLENGDDSIPISQNVQSIEQGSDQNPHSIEQIEDQNPNPNSVSAEEDNLRDSVEEQEPQSDDDEDAEGDADPETNEEEKDDETKRHPGTHKRKKQRQLGSHREKKLKQIETSIEKIHDLEDDDKVDENVEQVRDLEDENKTESSSQLQNVGKGGDLEQGGAHEEQQQKEPQDVKPVAPGIPRKSHKRKKMTARQKAVFEKKLNNLKENLNPIPFVPEKKLDFSKHEQLFKRLGLWDFVNMEFDQDIRSDLIAMLIANYNPVGHYSIVNNIRIKLSRADLARALKLPVKKDKSISLETSDFDSEALSEESILFIREFWSNWILLHEDTWILPKEVLSWNDLVKKGQLHKVDWPQSIWYMVEKELKQASEVGTLYFASHIQCMMKSQRDDLFKEIHPLEVPVDVEEDFDTTSLNDDDRLKFELQTELSLGRNVTKEEYELMDTMDYEESKQGPGGQAQDFLDKKSYMNSNCLQHCSTSEDNQQSQHGIEEVEVEDEDEDEEYDPQPKCSTMGGLASTDIFQEIGTTSITYSPAYDNTGQPSGDPFQSGIDAHFTVDGMPMHVNSFKREACHDDIEYHDTFSDHHHHMQMRSELLPLHFNTCIEQIHRLANKAKELYEEKEKEKANLNSNMNEELVTGLQHQKSNLMDYLQKKRCELQRREQENYKLDRELHLMSSLLAGYRNALKETQRAFSEYKQRNPEPEEPLYNDAGPGGLVLSSVELEKQHLEREDEEKIKRCMIIKQALADFQAGCLENFEGCKSKIHQFDKRLHELVEKVKALRSNSIAKKKMAEI